MASPVATGGLPWAARQQRTVNGWDELFTLRVQVEHPRVAHWWGQRTVGNVHGAWCYICDRMVTSWARSYPVTYMARATIEAHRNEHIAAEGQAPR